MIQDPQEYLQQWEKENNPFYPDEMRWDRVKVNTFLKDWKQQCNIAYVVGRSEQLKAFLLWLDKDYEMGDSADIIVSDYIKSL